FLTAHRAYGVERLDPADRDRYVADMATVAEALGSESAPRSQRIGEVALRAFGPELRATADARRAARYLIVPPGLSVAERVGYAPLVAAAIALLPVETRLRLRLPFTPVGDRLVVPPVTAGTLRIARWLAA
ncbi:MAG: oxygenase MpaB family protein, partial [Actinomycetota bacterium]